MINSFFDIFGNIQEDLSSLPVIFQMVFTLIGYLSFFAEIFLLISIPLSFKKQYKYLTKINWIVLTTLLLYFLTTFLFDPRFNHNLTIRAISMVLFLLWQAYWKVTSKEAEKIKPKTKPVSIKSFFEKTCHIAGWIFLFTQLCGFTLFPFLSNYVVQITGLLLQVSGIAIAVKARITLSSNWTQAYDYQIKKDHELVTSGIYKYIRHPIYTGLTLAVTGGLVIAQTYLFIPLFIALLFWSYSRGIREEQILTKAFGDKYKRYIKQTKMLIPFVF